MAEWSPAFEGQRPPFQPGNTAAVSHGAYSPALVEPAARDLVELLLADEDNAHLRAPRWRPALLNWARLQCRADRYGEHLDRLGIDEQMAPPRGGARSPVDVWSSLVKAATTAADRLGLTPVSSARLARDLASASTMTVLGARHPLRAALERISEQRAIEGTTVEQATDAEELGADDAG